MTGDETFRGREYTALMTEARDVERTAQFVGAAGVLTACVLLSSAVTTRHPGLALPVQLCAALGAFAFTVARHRVTEIATYLRRTYEQNGEAQWFTDRASRPSATWPNVAMMVLTQTLNVTAIVFAWVHANVSPHADLVSGAVTLVGMAFMVQALLEQARGEAVPQAVAFTPPQQGLREVPPPRRTSGMR